jgi:hypothetical protein
LLLVRRVHHAHSSLGVSLVEYDRVDGKGENYRRAQLRDLAGDGGGLGPRAEWMWEAWRAVSEEVLKASGPEPGHTILELVTGTGETGFAAARTIGPDGRLIFTDFAPEMRADSGDLRVFETGAHSFTR